MPPGLVAHLDAGALRFVEGQHRELAIRGIAAASGWRRVAPGALVLAAGDLSVFEPFGAAPNVQQILPGLRRAKDHRLQRDDIGLRGRQAAQILDRPLHALLLRFDPRIEQGQRTQRRNAAAVGRMVGPGAVGILLPLKVGDAAFDRIAGLLGRDVGAQRPGHERHDQRQRHQYRFVYHGPRSSRVLASVSVDKTILGYREQRHKSRPERVRVGRRRMAGTPWVSAMPMARNRRFVWPRRPRLERQTSRPAAAPLLAKGGSHRMNEWRSIAAESAPLQRPTAETRACFLRLFDSIARKDVEFGHQAP